MNKTTIAGCIFKHPLSDELLIYVKKQDDHILFVSFEYNQTFLIPVSGYDKIYYECYCYDGEHYEPECPLCKGLGSYKNHIYGFNNMEFVAYSCKDYMEQKS